MIIGLIEGELPIIASPESSNVARSHTMAITPMLLAGKS